MTAQNSLDEIDLEIIRLLVEDGRRPYNEIAELVGLSPPAVSDRVDRLRDRGIVRQFTVTVDRAVLLEGVPVLIELQALPTELDAVYRTVRDIDGIEHAFKTHDGTVVAHGTAPQHNLSAWIRSELDMSHVTDFDVKLVEDVSWDPEIDETEIALRCVECGNAVTDEGQIVQIGGETTPFCCPSCEDAFEPRDEGMDS